MFQETNTGIRSLIDNIMNSVRLEVILAVNACAGRKSVWNDVRVCTRDVALETNMRRVDSTAYI